MNGLKPCPFCGEEVNVSYSSNLLAFNFWHVKGSEKCPLYNPIQFSGQKIKSLAEAREAWNKR